MTAIVQEHQIKFQQTVNRVEISDGGEETGMWDNKTTVQENRQSHLSGRKTLDSHDTKPERRQYMEETYTQHWVAYSLKKKKNT